MDLTQVNPDGSVTTRYELTPAERSALEYARQSNVLVVVAAGNDGGVMSALGQASQEFDNIITVGAADGVNRADYSSYGYGLDILAPGGTEENPMLSTVGDGVGTMAGTSVASARVTGAVSQVWAANPDLSYRQVIELLKSTATDLDKPNWDEFTGAGLLNLAAAVLLAKVTTPLEYEAPASVIPETWSGEGKVTPSDRAAAVPMWPSVEPTSFTGRVMATIGANVRSGPGTSYPIVGSRSYNSLVNFDGWTYGERITDIALGTPDERWYRIAGTNNQWIASAIIDGNAPGSTPLPPGNSGGGGTPLPQPRPQVPINSNSANYRDGRVNPFAYRWQGQCTWYVYGRMLETGLLPAGAKANNWFLGDAWTWRRDAQRAGLPVTSTPTPGARGIVVWPPNTKGTLQWGHVAFLEEVYPDGRIRISESNWAGKGISERILTPAQYSGLSFVRLENATPNPRYSSPPAQPGKQREYRVRSGDTLSAIAFRELGNANRWREITKADGSMFTEAEARNLQVGISVYLPVSYKSGTGTPVTSSRGSVGSVTIGATPIDEPVFDIDFAYDSGENVKGWSRDRKFNAVVEHIKEYIFVYAQELGENAITDFISSLNEIFNEIKKFPNINLGWLTQKLGEFAFKKVLSRIPVLRAVLVILRAKEIWDSISSLVSGIQNLGNRVDRAETEADLDLIAEELTEISVSAFLRVLVDVLVGSVKLVNRNWANNLKQSKKNQRRQKTQASFDWAKLSGMLRSAAKGKGNFGIGAAARREVDSLGLTWVGKGYKTASDGKTLVSADGLRQYRPPSFKPNLNKWQANLEWRNPGDRQWQGNAHVDITDP